jgi:predicted RNase H-like HicB family nuclease
MGYGGKVWVREGVAGGKCGTRRGVGRYYVSHQVRMGAVLDGPGHDKDYPLPVRKDEYPKGETMHLKVVMTKGEDGWYVVTVPSLPGCISQGRTLKEAKHNIKEAIALYLEPDDEIVPVKGARVVEVAV